MDFRARETWQRWCVFCGKQFTATRLSHICCCPQCSMNRHRMEAARKRKFNCREAVKACKRAIWLDYGFVIEMDRDVKVCENCGRLK